METQKASESMFIQQKYTRVNITDGSCFLNTIMSHFIYFPTYIHGHHLNYVAEGQNYFQTCENVCG